MVRIRELRLCTIKVEDLMGEWRKMNSFAVKKDIHSPEGHKEGQRRSSTVAQLLLILLLHRALMQPAIAIIPLQRRAWVLEEASATMCKVHPFTHVLT
jgi:hypothetical protein